MTWKGIKPLVNLVEGTYEKGVKVLTKELEQLPPFNAAFWNFAQMGCDGYTLLAGILFLRKSLSSPGLKEIASGGGDSEKLCKEA